MRKDGATFVEEIVDTKFDTAFDDPAQGFVMVVEDVVDQEGVVEAAVLRWVERRGEGWARYVHVLKCIPYL